MRNFQHSATILAVVLMLATSFAQKTRDIYLLSGQSNATGQGVVQNLDSATMVARSTEFPRPFKADSRVQLFYLQGESIYGGAALDNGKSERTRMPLMQCSEDPTRFGPELGFGNRMMQISAGKDTIGIIKFAGSGASLHVDFYPGNSTSDSVQWGSQFLWFVRTVDQGMAALKAKGITPVIRGMLWQQGESDNDYATYATELGHFIDRVRAQWSVPNMLFVYGKVWPLSPNCAVCRAEQDVSQNSKTKYSKTGAFVILTPDLQLRKDEPGPPTGNPDFDNCHLGTAGQLELGRRMADTIAAKLQLTALAESKRSISLPRKTREIPLTGVKIYDLRGSKVFEARGSRASTIPAASIPAGCYVMRLQWPGGSIERSVAVAR